MSCFRVLALFTSVLAAAGTDLQDDVGSFLQVSTQEGGIHSKKETEVRVNNQIRYTSWWKDQYSNWASVEKIQGASYEAYMFRQYQKASAYCMDIVYDKMKNIKGAAKMDKSLTMSENIDRMGPGMRQGFNECMWTWPLTHWPDREAPRGEEATTAGIEALTEVGAMPKQQSATGSMPMLAQMNPAMTTMYSPYMNQMQMVGLNQIQGMNPMWANQMQGMNLMNGMSPLQGYGAMPAGTGPMQMPSTMQQAASSGGGEDDEEEDDNPNEMMMFGAMPGQELAVPVPEAMADKV